MFLLSIYLIYKNKNLIKKNIANIEDFIKTLSWTALILIKLENEKEKVIKKNEEYQKEIKELIEENKNLFNEKKKLQYLNSKKTKLLFYYKHKNDTRRQKS